MLQIRPYQLYSFGMAIGGLTYIFFNTLKPIPVITDDQVGLTTHNASTSYYIFRVCHIFNKFLLQILVYE